MNQPRTTDTALLVFSLSARSEAQRKRLIGSNATQENIKLFKSLNARIRKLAAHSGVDVIWMDEASQEGNDFASRFANAFKQTFDKGYKRVISIGNDTPRLTQKHIQQALSALESKDMVLGPAADGGIYLIGMHHKTFNYDDFLKLPWQQKTLFKSLCSKATLVANTLMILGVLSDIDTRSDLFSFIKTYSKDQIALIIAVLLTSCKAKISDILNILYTTYTGTTTQLLRAPPSLI